MNIKLGGRNSEDYFNLDKRGSAVDIGTFNESFASKESAEQI